MAGDGPELNVARRVPAEIPVLLDLLDEAFERRSWHGTNFRGSIRGLSAGRAAWRPGPGRHNIWEIVVHVAYWKYAVRRRLAGGKRGSFPMAGSNWFPRPLDPTERAWRSDVDLLVEEHRRLRATIAAPEPEGPERDSARARRLQLIRGVVAHDLYHAGQVQLLKRLGAKRAR